MRGLIGKLKEEQKIPLNLLIVLMAFIIIFIISYLIVCTMDGQIKDNALSCHLPPKDALIVILLMLFLSLFLYVIYIHSESLHNLDKQNKEIIDNLLEVSNTLIKNREKIEKAIEEMNKNTEERLIRIEEINRTIERRFHITQEELHFFEEESEKKYPQIKSLLANFVNDEKNSLDFIAYCKFLLPKEDEKRRIIFLSAINNTISERFKTFGIPNKPNTQIDLFREMAIHLHGYIDLLNNKFKQLEQEMLIRVVFDVQKGGILYYHISDDEYLFAATVDQEVMDNNVADVAMLELKKQLKKIKE